MLHCTSNRLFILKISNPSAATAGVLRSGIVGGAVRCKEDGGRRSGATLTDDDAADDGPAGEA